MDGGVELGAFREDWRSARRGACPTTGPNSSVRTTATSGVPLSLRTWSLIGANDSPNGRGAGPARGASPPRDAIFAWPVLSLDPELLLASLLPGAIGFVLFRYGRSMNRPPQIVVGMLMMVFPIFVPYVWLTLAITALLSLGLVVAVRGFRL